ncbi:hypothetical protein LTR28_003821, partial [Elasticomyces elasticus]
MPDRREYSVEEVMNLTVKDIQDPDGLMRERDEKAHSVVVNATELEDRLRQVRRSPSQSPTPPPDLEAEERRKLKAERESYKALLDIHGQPCYPIELAPDVYKNPGQYKDIISFPEFQQEVHDRRRRHGLEGEVRPPEDRDEQSSLDHWMEYQDYELRRYEALQRDLEEAQMALTSRRKVLAEAGLSTYEGVQELDFGCYVGLNMEHGREEGPARDKEMLAKRKLELAESRLKAAESDDLGDTVERGTWIRWFQEQAETAQIRLNAIPEYCKEDWLPGGKYYIQEGKDDRERAEKTDEACGKRYDDEVNAERCLRLAKKGLEVARSDGFGETVERAALVKIAQEDVRSARIQLEMENKSVEKIEVKGRVLRALGWIVSTKLKMERHRPLLEWIERQRCEIADGRACTEDGM